MNKKKLAEMKALTSGKSQEELLVRTQLKTFESDCKAALAKQALANTALLAGMAEECAKQAPLGSNEYRLIINAYAASAADTILGGQNEN